MGVKPRCRPHSPLHPCLSPPAALRPARPPDPGLFPWHTTCHETAAWHCLNGWTARTARTTRAHTKHHIALPWCVVVQAAVRPHHLLVCQQGSTNTLCMHDCSFTRAGTRGGWPRGRAVGSKRAPMTSAISIEADVYLDGNMAQFQYGMWSGVRGYGRNLRTRGSDGKMPHMGMVHARLGAGFAVALKYCW